MPRKKNITENGKTKIEKLWLQAPWDKLSNICDSRLIDGKIGISQAQVAGQLQELRLKKHGSSPRHADGQKKWIEELLSTCRSHNDRPNLIRLQSSQAFNQRRSGMLLIETEDVKTLTCLGLTERQAKVYLALLRTGLSKAEAISKASTIHRQEIYRVVAGLQEMGLVERKVNTPTLFSAIPIGEALKILVQRKTKEFSEIRGKTRILAGKFYRSDLQATPPVEEPYFSIISESDRGRKFRCALENVHETIDIVTIWKTFRQGFTLFDDSLKKALQKGVTLRVITEKPESETFPKWVIPALTKKSVVCQSEILNSKDYNSCHFHT